jgi:hypothetical protein
LPVHTPPADLDDSAVSAAVAAGWRLDPASISYQPVGFGSHHWSLVESSGRQWFVTVDDVDSPAELADLDAALTSAAVLHRDARLTFVGAPVPRPDGSLIQVLGRYAVTVYAHLTQVDDRTGHRDPGRVSELIAALHEATPTVARIARPDDGTLPGRTSLQRLLGGAGLDPSLGPYAGRFATLVSDHRSVLAAAFEHYDRITEAMAEDQQSWVITHGEPKADNIMITADGPIMIDWETARLAPPERDLWLIGGHRRYAELTGNQIRQDHLAFYRLRWDLADLSCFGDWFCHPHDANPDTGIGWQASVAICQRLAAGNPGPPWAEVPGG